MWKGEANEGDTEVQFQKDTMVIFASSENEDIWQGIRFIDIFFSIEILTINYLKSTIISYDHLLF